MGLVLDHIEGQTPLNEEEKQGLLVSTITTRGELDEFEQLNIETAVEFYLKRSFKVEIILTEKFIKTVHTKMFGNVWSWAGKFRTSNKNLGIDKIQIGIELRKLIDDCRYWIENKTYSSDEISLRFKHRIVTIHCFVNGNGRHSRLMADLFAEHIFGLPIFSWGTSHLHKIGESRHYYLLALKAADQGDFSLLIQFARS